MQDLVDRYTCVCERGWEGQDCHQEINECDPNPCQNEAECTVSVIMYNDIIAKFVYRIFFKCIHNSNFYANLENFLLVVLLF